MKAYYRLRRLLQESPSDKEWQAFETALPDFDVSRFRSSLFLTSSFDTAFREVADTFRNMQMDLKRLADSKVATDSQRGSRQDFYEKQAREHRNSLVEGGEIEQKIQKLKEDLQKYLKGKST